MPDLKDAGAAVAAGVRRHPVNASGKTRDSYLQRSVRNTAIMLSLLSLLFSIVQLQSNFGTVVAQIQSVLAKVLVQFGFSFSPDLVQFLSNYITDFVQF